MDIFLNVLIILAVIHLVEFFYFRKIIMQSKHGPFLGFLLTLIFGVLYISRIKNND
jgi:hypothetical protein